MLHVVIMAGGSGTRFWPQSRRELPKQLLPLVGQQTMLVQTAERCRAQIPAARTWVVTNAAQAAETARQLPELPAEQILVEPCGRNTAPCVGLAALHLLAVDPDAVMLVMPADHVVGTETDFLAGVAQAAQLVADRPDRLVLFGVSPTYPAVGFGYIERGAPLDGAGPGAYRVRKFHEKPHAERAAEYLAAGTYYWNCGIFVWRADAILAALARHEPELHAGLVRIGQALRGPEAETTLAREFPALQSVSIDVAVLERAVEVCVIEARFDWDDVGSWQALTRHLPADEAENTVDGPFCGLESKRCIVRTTPDHLVAAIGLEDCVIVHTPTATLVARRHDDDAMRALIKLLDAQGYGRFL